MKLAPTIVWFRQDLRLADNPALASVEKQLLAVEMAEVARTRRTAAWAENAWGRWAARRVTAGRVRCNRQPEPSSD